MPKSLPELQHLVFRDAPFLILMELSNSSNIKEVLFSSSLAKRIDVTYSHVVKLLAVMERKGLIEFEKKGRIKKTRLTKKGQEIALALNKAATLMG